MKLQKLNLRVSGNFGEKIPEQLLIIILQPFLTDDIANKAL